MTNLVPEDASSRVHLQSNLATYTAAARETRKKWESKSVERADKRHVKGLKERGKPEKARIWVIGITFRGSKRRNATVSRRRQNAIGALNSKYKHK